MTELQDKKLLELMKYIEKRYNVKGWPIPVNFPSFTQHLEIIAARKLRDQIKAETRKELLYEKSGGRVCQYCRRPFNSRLETLDHIIPRCRRGGNSLENLVICCEDCNLWKGSKTLEQWKELLVNCLHHKPKKYEKKKFHIFRGYDRRLINIVVENITALMKETLKNNENEG